MKPKVQELREAVREYALRLPGAVEDFPWGESVAKVNKKVFVFFGVATAEKQIIAVKLPASGADLLKRKLGEPTGYGLGKSGWVTASFKSAEEVPLDRMAEWIEESFRAIAPKKLVAAWDNPDAVPVKKVAAKKIPAKGPVKKAVAKKVVKPAPAKKTVAKKAPKHVAAKKVVKKPAPAKKTAVKKPAKSVGKKKR